MMCQGIYIIITASIYIVKIQYPSITNTIPVYKYKTGCQFFHQDLSKIYENTTLSIQNACFETYLTIVCRKIKNPSQVGDF